MRDGRHLIHMKGVDFSGGDDGDVYCSSLDSAVEKVMKMNTHSAYNFWNNSTIWIKPPSRREADWK